MWKNSYQEEIYTEQIHFHCDGPISLQWLYNFLNTNLQKL